MAFVEYFHIIRRRIWVLIISVSLTIGTALFFSIVMTPIYQSSVNVLVQPARTDFGLTQSAKLLLDSYVAFLDTDNSAAKVIESLQLDTLPETLRGNVYIAAEPQSFLIRIEIENENGQLANDIALSWAEILVQWRNDENQKQRREDRVTAIILDNPSYVLERPRKIINGIAGAILGFIIGAIVVLVVENLEAGIVRSRNDIERFLSISVIGSIPTDDRHVRPNGK